jgi:predicted phage-related endonuclease
MRTRNLNSTEVSALFDCCPYTTAFELHHRKKAGTDVGLEPNERMRWGTRLQDAIAEGIAEDRGWQIHRKDEYIQHTYLRLGASFDYGIDDLSAILEIKNVDSLAFKQGWLEDEDGNIEAPPHIELQVQQQLFLAQKKKAYIGCLVGGNHVVVLEREPNEVIIKSLGAQALLFWDGVEKGIAPSPLPRDADFIAKLYGYAEPGKVFDARGNESFQAMAGKHTQLGQQIKELQQQRDFLKAQMLMQIGDSEKVLGDDFSVTAGTVGPCEVSYTREGYRMFRVNRSKKK